MHISRNGSVHQPMVRSSALSRFGGKKATRAAQARMLNGDQLKCILDREVRSHGDPYIGQGLPSAFMIPGTHPDTQKHKGLKTLDEMASLFSKLDISLYRMAGFNVPFCLPSMQVKLGHKTAQLDYVGSGNFGSVFKLTLDQQSFAFKVFFKRHQELLYSGPYSETALGAFMTGRHVRNMPHLIMANPQAGWMLTEWIDPQFHNPHNRGPRWQDMDLRVLDPVKNVENEKRDQAGEPFRVDYGHLAHPQRKKPVSHPGLAKVFQTLDPAT